MPDSTPIENNFLTQLTTVVEKNISNEQFGVSELAEEMNMSRSNLLRKVKKETKLSVSQLISQVRLKRAMEMLRKSALNVSEVSHQVGFSSTSYFIKCFREYYGYPPGEVGKRESAEMNSAPVEPSNRKQKFVILGSVVLIVALAIGLLSYYALPSSVPAPIEKSIAVLPFINDSNDSTNVYLINGLMESTLTNLSQIKDLKVLSRTSAEKYRNTTKSVQQMAKELNVQYFVEGSGQKIGDRILLNIQLIEGSTDRHLWAKQYRRETKDIFELQQEIAKNIAEEIQVIITPEEEKRMAKKPTDDLVAYDYFLKGKDLFYKSTSESLKASIPYFKKAVERDNKFALAYANGAMVYYYLDIFHVDKKYADELSTYADKAFTLDPNLGEGLIAKALDFVTKKEYEMAIPYLEKALEYDPNSGLVVHFLTEFYTLHVPNTTKYLEYAIQGVVLDSASQDSVTRAFKYFHLSNGLVQTGFIDEAILYINKSLNYDSKSLMAGYLKAWILFAKSRDPKQTKNLLIQLLSTDTTRIDVVQEVGKISYFMRDYKSAYEYYKRLTELREAMQLDIYKHENLKMAIVFSKMGFDKKSEVLMKSFKDYADKDPTLYKHLNLSAYYSYKGDAQKSIEHLKLFSKEDNYVYWVLLWEIDPAFDTVKDNPEFKKVMRDIETKFWNINKKVKVTLEKNGMP